MRRQHEISLGEARLLGALRCCLFLGQGAAIRKEDDDTASVTLHGYYAAAGCKLLCRVVNCALRYLLRGRLKRFWSGA